MPPALIIPPHNQAGGNNIYGNPRQDNVTLNKLEGVEVHDGFPIPFFKQTWIKAFKKGLVSKTQDGYTMVSVFEETHMGGPTWVASNNALPAVPAAGPVAGTIYQHNMTAAENRAYLQREQRLLDIILLHIDDSTPIHAELSQFANNGFAAMQRLIAHSHVPNNSDLEAFLESFWSNITVDSLQLSINGKTLSTLAVVIIKVANYFDTPKTVAQQKTAFLRALPVQMVTIKTAEITQPNPAYVDPAVYPANISPTVAHPFAGRIHPNANQTNMMALAQGLSVPWVEMLRSGAIEAQERTPVDIELSAMLRDYMGDAAIPAVNFISARTGGPRRKQFPKKTQSTSGNKGKPSGKPKPMSDAELKRVCLKCGGIGHLAAFKLSRGGVSYCRTFNQLPASAASQLKYPWLGNKTLTEIRDAVAKSSKKDVAKAMFADVAEIITAIDEAGTDKESESDDHEYDLNFLSELNFGADEDGDEKPDDEPDSDEQE